MTARIAIAGTAQAQAGTIALVVSFGNTAYLGLPYVDATTDEDNFASQRVLEANGGVLIDRLQPPPSLGKGVVRRYRFVLV